MKMEIEKTSIGNCWFVTKKRKHNMARVKRIAKLVRTDDVSGGSAKCLLCKIIVLIQARQAWI